MVVAHILAWYFVVGLSLIKTAYKNSVEKKKCCKLHRNTRSCWMYRLLPFSAAMPWTYLAWIMSCTCVHCFKFVSYFSQEDRNWPWNPPQT